MESIDIFQVLCYNINREIFINQQRRNYEKNCKNNLNSNLHDIDYDKCICHIM